MPELPEVEAIARSLATRMRNRRIASLQIYSSAAMKTYDPPLDALVGLPVVSSQRRGKFLALDIGNADDGPLHLVIHLALAGWIRWHDGLGTTTPARRSPVVARLRLDDGSGIEITEQGTQKRLAIYLVRSLGEVPGIARLGPDVLDPELDEAHFTEILRGSSRPLKALLVDQTVFAGLGNAYSDELLHRARLSPYRPARRLDDAEVARLYSAMRTLLDGALQRASGVDIAALKRDKREHMAVHARGGQPCPDCNTVIRSVATGGRSFEYCPGCQTDGRILADRRLSRLLR